MRVRHYVTVHEAGDGAWMPQNAGIEIKKNASENLRLIKIHHAYDYAGFDIVGVLMQRGGRFDLARVEQWVDLEQGEKGVRDTRIVISSASLAEGGPSRFGLLLEITSGDHFGWELGRNGSSGVVTIDRERRALKICSAIQDMFQDIMLANDESVQAVLMKWRQAGGSDTAFFQMKASFASAEVAAGRAGGQFARFRADGYASFASISRQNFGVRMNEIERTSFTSLWTRFLVEKFCSHFLDVGEAISLVTTRRFRNISKGLNSEGGGRIDGRTLHGMFSRCDLRKVLSDPQLVSSNGSYILCFWTTKSGGSVDRLGPVFGWVNEQDKRPRKFKLIREENYSAMLSLVEDGLVTPIRLFLKQQ